MIQTKEYRFNLIKRLYWSIIVRKYNFWIWFWYRRDRCPVCHQKIYWEKQFESIWDETGYFVPYHCNEDQNDANKDEYCEGVC